MRLLLTYLSFLCLPFGAAAQHLFESGSKEDVAFTTNYIEADRYRLLGDPEEALKRYQSCLDIYPKSDAVYFQMGQLYLGNKDFNRASEAIEKAHKLDPKNKWYMLALGQIQTDQQEFKAADKTYTALRKAYPENAAYILLHANLLLYAGETKDAMKAFDEYEEMVGIDPEVSIQKFKYYISKEKYDDAVDEMNRLIEAFPNEPQYYSYLADLYKAHGKTKEALEVYARAMKVDPDNPYIQLSLAEYYERNNQLDSAFVYLNKAYANSGLDIDTKVALLLRMYPRAEQDVQTRSRALALCDQLTLAHPNEAKSHSVKGDFLYLDGQAKEAREAYYKTAEIDASKFAIWNQILLIDSELNDPEAMKKDSEKALALFPTQPTVYLFNGIANNQLENYQTAAKSLKAGAQLVIGNPFLSSQLCASLGDAYHELGRHSSSDSAYEASLEYDPDNLYVLNNYSYFLSLRKTNLERAEQMSAQSIHQAPQNASYLDTYGWILYQMGKYEQAEEYLKRALVHGGDSSAEVLEHYGDTLFHLGRIDEAINYWVKAKNAGGDANLLQQKIDSRSVGD